MITKQENTVSRIGYTEPEAAQLLGIAKHVLRDARLRGEIKAKRVGKQYIYSLPQLQKLIDPEAA